MRASSQAACVLLVGLSAGCIDRGYPLGSSGSVDVRFDTAGVLFAADQLDVDGKGALPRQAPYGNSCRRHVQRHAP